MFDPFVSDLFMSHPLLSEPLLPGLFMPHPLLSEPLLPDLFVFNPFISIGLYSSSFFPGSSHSHRPVWFVHSPPPVILIFLPALPGSA
jgi:hypothetical protein